MDAGIELLRENQVAKRVHEQKDSHPFHDWGQPVA
jgi:hypothetical protein